ncbi:MAG: hypothetical protein GY861_09130 [bacterium]|nr:hypothetical protein [bacterium]
MRKKELNHQLVAWIMKKFDEGYSSQRLLKYLVQQGHKFEDVKAAIHYVNTGEEPLEKEPKTFMTIVMLWVVFVVVVATGAFLLLSSSDIACNDMSCFEEKFAKCKKASITTEVTTGVVYYYEIKGENNGLCEVISRFESNPMPELVGPEMTCRYDHSDDLEAAMKDLTKCDGPLFNLMSR